MIEKIKKYVTKIEKVLFTSIFSFMAIVLILHVLLRYVFNNPLIWTDEVLSIVQGTITFLGIGYCFTRNQHTSLSLLYDRVPPIIQIIFDIITNSIMIICLSVLIKTGFGYVQNQVVRLGTVSWLYKSYFYIFIPIGFIIALVHILSRLLKAFKRIVLLKGGN